MVKEHPPLEVCEEEGRCGAVGPVDELEDGQTVVLRCTRLDPDHGRRHRNLRVYPDRRWVDEYELVRDDEGEIVGSQLPEHRRE